MKKIAGAIAIIISFALLASSEVSASSAKNTKAISKGEVIEILSANQANNIKIDLPPIVIELSLPETEVQDSVLVASSQTKEDKQTKSGE